MRATERSNRYFNYRYFMYGLGSWREERSTWPAVHAPPSDSGGRAAPRVSEMDRGQTP